MAWFTDNIGSIIIVLAAAVVVGAIIFGLVRAKKKGKSVCGCGGDCAHCAAHCPHCVSPGEKKK